MSKHWRARVRFPEREAWTSPSPPESLLRAGKAELAPGLEHTDGHRIRQVQAAIAGLHGQPQDVRWRQAVQHDLRQAASLGTEQQGIARREAGRKQAGGATGGQGEDSCRPRRVETSGQIRMLRDAREFTVVEPRPSQSRLVQRETQRMNQMQARPGIGAQTDYIAGVGRNLGLVEDDMQPRLL